MTEVTLSGEMVCASSAEAKVVEHMLPQHVLSSRAEPGCLFFEVTRCGSSLAWDVAERFDNEDSFHAHQARVAESAWGAQTATIRRDYTVTGLSAKHGAYRCLLPASLARGPFVRSTRQTRVHTCRSAPRSADRLTPMSAQRARNPALATIIVIASVATLIGMAVCINAMTAISEYDSFRVASNMATILGIDITETDPAALQASHTAQQMTNFAYGAASIAIGLIAMMLALHAAAIGRTIRNINGVTALASIERTLSPQAGVDVPGVTSR